MVSTRRASSQHSGPIASRAASRISGGTEIKARSCGAGTAICSPPPISNDGHPDSSRRYNSMAIERPDAIIVGSGAGGGTAARVLTARGWNVVVLEKGRSATGEDFLPYDELHFSSHKALIPKAQRYDPQSGKVVSDDPMIYGGTDGE